MDEVWAAENDRGLAVQEHLFTSTSVSSQTRYACEHTYHTQAFQPLFLYWQRAGTDRGERLTLDGYLGDASLQFDRDKPSDVPPAAIAYPSGVTAGGSGPWYEPGCHITDDLWLPRECRYSARHLRTFNGRPQIPDGSATACPLRGGDRGRAEVVEEGVLMGRAGGEIVTAGGDGKLRLIGDDELMIFSVERALDQYR